jgi:hypothetical protein
LKERKKKMVRKCVILGMVAVDKHHKYKYKYNHMPNCMRHGGWWSLSQSSGPSNSSDVKCQIVNGQLFNYLSVTRQDVGASTISVPVFFFFFLFFFFSFLGEDPNFTPSSLRFFLWFLLINFSSLSQRKQ